MSGTPNPLQERRQGACYAISRGLSERRACVLVNLGRSTARYASRDPDGRMDADLVEQIRTVQAKYSRFGVRRVWATLRRQGRAVNHKRVQRVMRQYQLVVVRRRKSKRIRSGASVPCQAEYPNHVWTIDFQEDALLSGRKVRILNVLDEFTREWLAVWVGGNASARIVANTLLALFADRGVPPAFLRSDNGGEFIAQEVQQLLANAGSAPWYIEPGSPWQNPFVESFHSRLRDEFLNREAFNTVSEFQVRIEACRRSYNDERPHSSLGYQTPTEFRLAWERAQCYNGGAPERQQEGGSPTPQQPGC